MASLATLFTYSDIWERIAYHVLARPDSFLGPPADLCSLCLISHSAFGCLGFGSKNDSRLYARLFMYKFDTKAAKRRLGERWLNTHCLAIEFRKRIDALKRVRTRRKLCRDDLWTCYLMMLENDGKNERQLEWANILDYLRGWTFSRGPQTTFLWYNDVESSSLLVALWWMLSRRELLSGESECTRTSLAIGRLQTFILSGFRFPSVYCPDSVFSLPIDDGRPLPRPASCSMSPPVASIIHYSHQLKIAAPLLNPVALLGWTVREEQTQASPSFLGSIPATRAQRASLGQMGPTVEDVFEFQGLRAHTPHRLPLTLDNRYDQQFPEDEEEILDEEEEDNLFLGSSQYDADWYREVSCFDPFVSPSPLSGVVYEMGSITGSWGGRYVFTGVDTHVRLTLNHGHLRDTNEHLFYQPLYMTLREHHCFHWDEPLSIGSDALEGDNFLNAWLPKNCTVNHLEDAIEVFDPNSRRSVRYETYFPMGPDGTEYSSSVSEKLRSSGLCEHWYETAGDDYGEEDREYEGERTTKEDVARPDQADDYVDTVLHRDSGIADILITGETETKYGEAWGHYTFIGRVRPFDGFIVLLRIPRNPSHGRWIFSGYIHGGNFAGRWRETTTPAGTVGYEGGFVVSRTD